MIIGLTGSQRAGKTTAWNYFHETHGAIKLSIGQAIKDISHKLLGTVFMEQEKDLSMPELNGKTPRDLYIHVGNMDEFKHSLFVEEMLRQGYEGPGSVHVIESVGKPFQYLSILQHSMRNNDTCCILDIIRPGYEYKDSRRPIADWKPPIEVVNGDSVDEFYKQLDEAYVYAIRHDYSRDPQMVARYMELYNE